MSDSPCQAKWITEAELVAGCDCAVGLDPAVQAQLVTAASQILYVLLGRQITGQCTATVRPDVSMARCGYSRGWDGGPAMDGIPLQWPVISITSVLVDGVALDPSEYTVYDEQVLVRLDDANGRNPGWPACNDFGKPTTEVGTWSITYVFGYPISEDIKLAVLEVAADFARAIAGRATALPASATSVARGGVNLNLQRVADAVKEAGSALPQVAKVIALYNPDEARMPPFVWSPEAGPTLHSL